MPRAWNDELKSSLLHRGFILSKCDASLYYYCHNDIIVLLLLYVDDVIITGNNYLFVVDLMSHLDSKFALKDLTQLSYVLGIQITYLPFGIHLNPSKYIFDLLEKVHLQDAKSCSTPSVTGKHLYIHDGEPLDDPLIYCSTLGGPSILNKHSTRHSLYSEQTQSIYSGSHRHSLAGHETCSSLS